MSKRKSRTDDPSQLTIFDFMKAVASGPSSSTQGSMNIQIALQGVLSEGIKRSSLSRWEIAGKDEHAAGR